MEIENRRLRSEAYDGDGDLGGGRGWGGGDGDDYRHKENTMRRKRTKYGTLATLTFKRKLKTLENPGKRKIREKQLATESQPYELQIYSLGVLASAFVISWPTSMTTENLVLKCTNNGLQMFA